MKNKLILLLTVLFTSFACAQTLSEKEWNDIMTEKKTVVEAVKTPKALEIYNRLIEANSLTRQEAIIIALVAPTVSDTEYARIYRQLNLKSLQGDGADYIAATLKFWDEDATGWTVAMMKQRYDAAKILAIRSSTTPEFKQLFWSILKDRAAYSYHEKIAFKQMRSTLSKAQQVEVTAKQKNILIALTDRTPAINAWLAEISADLVALQLD